MCIRDRMVLCVHGGTGANAIVCQALCEPGSNVVSILPNYQQYYSIPEALGTEAVSYTHLFTESAKSFAALLLAFSSPGSIPSS